MSTPSTTGMTSPTASTTSTAGPHVFGIEWNAENRLTAVKQGGNTLASFTYDGQGRRATKTAAGVTTTYIYDGDQFLEERPGAGTPKRYVYGLGIDRPLAQAVGGTTSHFLADHLGSIVQVTDSTGIPILAREYDPWGNLLQGSSTPGFAFTGREWEPETNLYYYRARYYDAPVGRFTSEDAFAQTGSNRYSYVGNRPLAAIDPSGLVELNLLKEEPLHTAAEKCISPTGVFTVAAHGNPRIVLDQFTGQRLDAKALATRIRQRPGWKNKPERIWLVGCEVATGEDSLAQLLADELKCPVIGVADGKVKWYASLQQYCGFSPDPYSNGHWTTKQPRK